MSQISGYFRDKLKLTVHKVIFVKPIGNGKYLEVCQRYFSPKKNDIKIGKSRVYPVDPAAWVRQSGNRFLQYKDYDVLREYNFYDSLNIVKPNGKVMQAVELAAAQAAAVAKAVLQGGQLQAGVVLLVLAAVAGLMGGMMLGYFGLPMATGQHLVSNAVQVVQP